MHLYVLIKKEIYTPVVARLGDGCMSFAYYLYTLQSTSSPSGVGDDGQIMFLLFFHLPHEGSTVSQIRLYAVFQIMLLMLLLFFHLPHEGSKVSQIRLYAVFQIMLLMLLLFFHLPHRGSTVSQIRLYAVCQIMLLLFFHLPHEGSTVGQIRQDDVFK